MASVQALLEEPSNPLEIVEQLAVSEDWQVDRSAENELNLTVAGGWADYHICFNWHEEIEGLHLACTFDATVPEDRRSEVSRLLGQINEQLWVGHFDLWQKEGAILYRNGLLLSGCAEITEAQCEMLLRIALEASERYYPAFQFVMWGGKDAEAAMESSLLEPMGEA
jgi:hypothetical protein